MTEAALGFRIDSSPAVKGAADLDQLTASAGRTEQAIGKLEAEAAGLGGALGKAADGARKAVSPVDSLGRSLGAQDDHVRAFRAEVERLTMRYQPLAKATRDYEAAVSEIGRAHRLGVLNTQQMTQALDRERMAYERLKTSATAASSAVKAANANNRMGNERTAGINAGYQAQDIVVSALGGSPAGLIGFQQGTQLAAAISTMERPVAGLAGAFASLLSPVNLVTIGLTAGTAALIQYFTTAESGGDKTNALFEEQNDLIRRAAALWGDAAPQLKAYVDELDRADKITQGREASEILAGRELEGLSENLDSIKQQGTAAFRALRGDPNNAVIIRDLREAWGDLRDRLDEGTASMADLNRVQGELANAVSQYGVPEVLAFRDAFDEVTAAIFRGVEAAQKARSEWIKAIAGGTNVQDIVAGSFFTDNGRTMRTADFMPRNPGVPTSRPNIELSGDPDATTILNSDGRLTSVPIPGQRPNFFELESQKEKVDDVTKAYRQAAEAKADFWLDISFQERQAERSAMDRQVASTLTRYGFNEDLNSPEANAIRQGLQQEEAKDAFKGFFQGIRQEAWENGGKIGDALVKSALNAAQKASEKAWDAIFDPLATAAANWLTGGSGKSSGASGVVSNLLGGVANDNSAFAAPIGAVTRSSLGPVSGSGAQLAWNFWKSKGLADHQVAGVLGNIKAESAFNPLAVGDGGNAFGLYQHNDRRNSLFNAIGGKGNLSNALAQHEFAYSELMGPENRAWQALTRAGSTREATAAFAGFERPSGFSWGNPEGAHNFAGRLNGAEEALAKFGGTAQQATQGLGQFGNGLSQVGSSLATGGSGGGSGWLSFLSGTIFSGSGQLARSGGIGLFANGTNYAPGGLSIVGERGPELVNLPQGAQVFDTNRSARMMGRNDNNNAPANLNVNVIGANGDEHVRALVRQGVGQALSQYNEQQRRVGFGETQKRFVAQKG